MSLPDQFAVITQGDKSSPTWGKLKAHLMERRDKLRAKNDNDLNEYDTAKLRGQIAEVTALINMDKDRPVID